MRKIALLLAAIVVVLVAIYVLGVVRNEEHAGVEPPAVATVPTTPTIPTIATTPATPMSPATATTPVTSTTPAAAMDRRVATASSEAAATGTAATDAVKAVNSAIDATLGDHAQYQRVFAALQAGVAARDAAAVAALVEYPFAATIDGKRQVLKDAAAFVQHYDAIVTPAIARVVAAQQYADLFVNYKGVMLGSGEVWINGICRDDACKRFDARVVTIQPGA